MIIDLGKDQFDEDISLHKMIVESDDGNGTRVICCKRPNTMICHFRICTFADYLVYTGDLGTYVFKRQKDMFTFFRGDDISPRYWGEKLQAADRQDDWLTFDYEEAISALREIISEEDEKTQQEIIDHFDYCCEDETGFWSGIRDCEALHEALPDFWCDLDTLSFKKYSWRYLWSCYAIVWTIKQYDELIAAKAA